MQIFTIADDRANLGYSNTIKALAVQESKEYSESCHLNYSTNIEDEKINKFIEDIKKEVSKMAKVCLLFAGGEKSVERIQIIQKKLKEELPNSYKNIKFIYNTERFNEGDNFKDIKNLEIITQETLTEEQQKELNLDKSNIIHTVDISASANTTQMENSAKIFEEQNRETLEKIKEPLEKTKHFFYLGGRGKGFSEEEKIDFSKEYKDFAKKSLEEIQKTEELEPLVIFTHGFRSFTKLDGKNYFKPIEEMYKYIQENLKEGQEAYIFSQNLIDEKRIPTIKKITKSEIEDIELEGIPYGWSLKTAEKEGIDVIATYEQQNFPIEAITMGISPEKISGIDWGFKKAGTHEKVYEETIKKGEIKTASSEFKKILLQKKSHTIDSRE